MIPIKPETILHDIDMMWTNMSRDERGYIGASEIGHECTRYLWLKFHKYVWPEHFPPRMLRLFNRGHREEYQFESMLKAIGFKVIDGCQGQGGFKKGFFAGHWDGKLSKDDLIYTPEYKSSNAKNFKILQLENVKEAQPKHYAQMCVYAKEQDSNAMLYMSVNKDDDDLHIEVLPRDDIHADAMHTKALDIATRFDPPPKIGRTASDFKCKFCNAKNVCHAISPLRMDCRNCVHVDKDPVAGKFTCELGNELKLCKHHAFNPLALKDVYHLEIEDMNPETKTITFLRKSGDTFTTGGESGLTSDEVMQVLVG